MPKQVNREVKRNINNFEEVLELLKCDITEAEVFCRIKNEEFPCENKKAIIVNGKYLTTVGPDYSVLPHIEALDMFQSELLRSKLDYKINTFYMTPNKSKFYLEMMFPGYKHTVAKLQNGHNDVLNPRVILVNAIDGSRKFGFELGFYRFVCKNGLRIGKEIFKTLHVHSKNMNIEGFCKDLEDTIKVGEKRLQSVTKLVDEKIERLQGAAIIEDFINEKKIMPQKFESDIKLQWMNEDLNQWGLYNAFTNVVTHKILPNNYERARVMELAIDKQFQNGLVIPISAN